MVEQKSRWIPAKDAVLAMARICADEMKVDWSTALKQSQATILRYMAAGHWPARAGAYHCEFQPVHGIGRKLEKTRNPENDHWVIPREYWQLIQRSGAHQNVNWHLGEFDLPPHEEAAGIFSGFARNVEIDGAYLPARSQTVDSSQIEPTGDAGRPEKGATQYIRELERRIENCNLEKSLREQARVLYAWFCEQYPDRQAPTARTIENRIRSIYRNAGNATK